MKLIITIQKMSDEKYSQNFKFTEFPIKIGRESNNEVFLIDEKLHN